MGRPESGRRRDGLAERAPRDARAGKAWSRDRRKRSGRLARRPPRVRRPAGRIAPRPARPRAKHGRLRRAAGSRPASSTATPISSMAAIAPQEFEMRLAGASYEEIARAGGGILSTVRATRAASEEDLVGSAAEAPRRADRRRRDDDRNQVRLRPRRWRPSASRSAPRAGWPSSARSPSARRFSPRMRFRRSLPRGARPISIKVVGDDDPRARPREPRRRGRRFLRAHRLHAGRSRAGLRRRPAARTAGQAARRPIVERRRRGARSRVQRPFGRSPRIRGRGGRRGDG